MHPDRSIIKSLKGAEKSFVQVLADGLSDSWFIFTRQDLWTPHRPYEIDVLVMHESALNLWRPLDGYSSIIKRIANLAKRHYYMVPKKVSEMTE